MEGGVVTVVTVEPAGRAGVPQDVSGAVTHVIVRCVRSRGGDFGVAQMLAMAGEHRPVEMLEDPRSWSTHDEVVSLLAAAERVTGETSMGWCVGEELLRQRDGADTADLLRSLGSPAELLRNVTEAAARLITVSSLEPLEVGENHAVLRATTRPRLPRHRYLCELTKGLLSQVPAIFGLSTAVIDEPECQARGGRCCLYCLTWEDEAGVQAAVVPGATFHPTTEVHGADEGPAAAGTGAVGDPRPEGAVPAAAASAGEPSGITEAPGHQARLLADRLEEAARSTADLVSGGELSALLASLAARAAGAVGASRYLLAMGQGAGRPPMIHQAGLDNAEAGTLARELLASDVPASSGTRLVVDVATHRHRFGRFAAYYQPGEDPPAGARRILSLHANCAAAAVELATAAAASRQSEATTRALLELSGALSRAGTVAVVAQSLADAVPTLAGCERSSVLLWDPFEQRLILQAWSVAEGPQGAQGAAGAGQEARVHAPAVSDAAGQAGGPPWVVADADADIVPVLSASRDVTVVDPTADEPSLRAFLARTGATCSILIPLFSDEEFVGLVSGEYLVPPRIDPRADGGLLALLRAVADQAVTALQSAWLLEQVGPLAWHDALTGLPNRRLLEHRAHRALEHNEHPGTVTTLFFVDLDRFKRVNDTFGHATGDALIRQVAQRLRDVVRRQDTVARLGGDEFAVLLPDLADMGAVRQMATRMLQAIRVPYRVDGNELHASASIGVAVWPSHGDDYDELLIHADEAMYRSKGGGRDTYTVYAPDVGPADGLMSLDPDLHHAVERNELFVVYQPAVDLRTNQVVGVEALVRWRHPRRGVIEPGAFIAQAEESEVIIDIDRFVLREVARQVREWIDGGLNPVRVSVNVSRRDLEHPRFADTVLEALRERRLPGHLLEIEFTGQIGADDHGVAGQTIERLRREGVRFAVDGFGAGASSLERLAALPVRTLKIARSLVQLIGPSDELGPLTSAIIAAAGKLGMECVAQGVETPHQRATLLQGGCTTAQGYLYGRPLLPDGMRRLLQPPPAASPAGVPADAGS
jgi:diguanylate cyclase (GGDEF)-like protein